MHPHKFWCLLNLSTVLETEKRERIFSPGDEERFWQAVMDIDNEVVIGNRVDIRPWKLSIDKNSLQNKHHHPLRKKKTNRESHNPSQGKNQVYHGTCWRTPSG